MIINVDEALFSIYTVSMSTVDMHGSSLTALQMVNINLL